MPGEQGIITTTQICSIFRVKKFHTKLVLAFLFCAMKKEEKRSNLNILRPAKKNLETLNISIVQTSILLLRIDSVLRHTRKYRLFCIDSEILWTKNSRKVKIRTFWGLSEVLWMSVLLFFYGPVSTVLHNVCVGTFFNFLLHFKCFYRYSVVWAS